MSCVKVSKARRVRKWKGCCDLQGVGSQPQLQLGSVVERGSVRGQETVCLCVGMSASPPLQGLLEVKKNPSLLLILFPSYSIRSKKTAENTAHFKCLHVTNEGFVRARNVRQRNCAIRRVITGFTENINSSVPREVWSGDGTKCRAGSRRSYASSFSGVFATGTTASSRHHCHWQLALLPLTHSET